MIDIRPATVDDRRAINALLRDALNAGADPRYDAFLEWKHRENPFGSSFEWVATIDGEVVGYRAFLRWELTVEGVVRRAVRAVDTATAREHQGRGIFRKLTLHAVDQLSNDGVAWVFNTPNDASRPGYLKMGWTIVGRIPVGVIPRSPLVLRHLRRARQAAERWSEPTDAFVPAVDALTAVQTSEADWATNRTADFLRWRYGFAPLHYRAVVSRDDTAVVFRVRRRGPLLEAFLADVIGPAPVSVGRVARDILRATRADVAVVSGRVRPRVALPVRGPLLTWRPLADERVPSMDQLRLAGGDVELF